MFDTVIFFTEIMVCIYLIVNRKMLANVEWFVVLSVIFFTFVTNYSIIFYDYVEWYFLIIKMLLLLFMGYKAVTIYLQKRNIN